MRMEGSGNGPGECDQFWRRTRKKLAGTAAGTSKAPKVETTMVVARGSHAALVPADALESGEMEPYPIIRKLFATGSILIILPHFILMKSLRLIQLIQRSRIALRG